VLDTAGDEALSTCVSEKIGGWMWGEDVDGEVGHPINIKKGEGVLLHPEEEEGEADAAPEGDDAVEAEEPEAGADGDEIGEETGEEEALPDGDEVEGEEDDLLADDDDALMDDAVGPEETVYNGLADFTMFQRMRSGNEVETHWDVEHQGNRVVVTQVSPLRTLRYEYLVHYDSLELADVAVYQVGRSVPVMHMDINPALPDLRRPFSGRAKSTYVIDVNGQGGYATGEVEAWWSESGPKVKVMPSAPEWTTDGDLVSSIVFRDEGFDVLVQKVSD